MTSIKCVSCGLVNFATVQFCKRCNNSLSQPDSQFGNETRVITPNNTAVRPTIPLPNSNQATANLNHRSISPPPNFPAQNYSTPPPPPIYQPVSSPSGNQKTADSSWTLPRFPKEERPPQYNQAEYSNHQPQYPLPHNQYFVNEVPYRRFGNEIALHEKANLPPACVKCGCKISPGYSGEYILQKCRWHHPLVYIALLSPIIYLILALALSKTVLVNIPLCEEHQKNREVIKGILIGSGFLALTLIIAAIFFEVIGFAIFLLFLSILCLSVAHEHFYKPLRIRKIDGSYSHLKGASPEFLNLIPY
jgi:hypothetical protein